MTQLGRRQVRTAPQVTPGVLVHRARFTRGRAVLLFLIAQVALASSTSAQEIVARQNFTFGQRTIEWQGATIRKPTSSGLEVVLKTNRGQIPARYHPARAGSAGTRLGVIWVSGAGGGLDGPARRIYVEASERLQAQGIAGLRLDYRKPQALEECVLDTLCGAAFFARQGINRVVVVGHSFGGAVAVCAGATTPNVRAVVALSSQTLGAVQMAPFLAPRPLLVVHGSRDNALPVANAREIYGAAAQPKELKILADAGHGLTVARPQLLELLLRWIPRQLGKSR